MRINIICADGCYTVIEITECGAAFVISITVQYLPICIVRSWCAKLTTLQLSWPIIWKSGILNLLEPTGSVQELYRDLFIYSI